MSDHVETLKKHANELENVDDYGDVVEAIRVVVEKIERLRAGKCSTCKATNGGPSPVITHLQQNLAFVGGEKKQAEVRIEAMLEMIDMYEGHNEISRSNAKQLRKALRGEDA